MIFLMFIKISKNPGSLRKKKQPDGVAVQDLVSSGLVSGGLQKTNKKTKNNISVFPQQKRSFFNKKQ